jgi:hypothetical protein
MQKATLACLMVFVLGAGIEAAEPGKEDCAAAVAALKKTLGNEFIVRAESPFVVAGNLSAGEFNAFAQQTVMGCYKAFYHDFFDTKPDQIITVYLFKGDASYRKWAEKLFGDTNVSHYGYYKPGQRALVMNISTGGGTLVHEMTHALAHFDFPEIPAWFNEGMGSLFEQCSTEGGHLKGLINWRYLVLKRGLDNNRLVQLKDLVATDSEGFYKDPYGMHYAEARYLCMYLQEKGHLPKFYKQFRANHEQDPTGRKTLEEVTGEKIDVIEKNWLAWVYKLKSDGCGAEPVLK